jgi:tripartite-type tricarboxylate transporter receptor subunit TctC
MDDAGPDGEVRNVELIGESIRCAFTALRLSLRLDIPIELPHDAGNNLPFNIGLTVAPTVRHITPMKTKRALLVLAFAAALPAAHAQTGKWPDKPVRVIVPFPPGGTTDVVARTFAPRLSEEYGQQFIVDNRGGAGGAIGAEIAARTNPDGYTIIVVTSSYAPNAALYKLPYDPVKGIAPISMISILPFILVVHPSVKANNLKEFVELVRAQPGVLNIGSPGTGSTPHLASELFQQMARIKMVHVAYKGDGPALTDLIGGQIQTLLATELVLGAQIKAGKLRALAVTTAQRSPAMPDLPTIGEVVPGYAVDGWAGMWAPGGTPKEIVARLNQSVARILKLPEVQERLRAGGAEPAHSTPEGFAHAIARDIATWAKVVKDGNIKVD